MTAVVLKAMSQATPCALTGGVREEREKGDEG